MEKAVIDDDGVAVVVPNEDGIVNRLRKARVKAGITQQDVAERIGIAQTAVSRLGIGAHSPSLDMVERYAEAVGCRLKIGILCFLFLQNGLVMMFLNWQVLQIYGVMN